MNLETTANRIESLEGKVLALQMAVRALIACHPDPERAIAVVAEHLEEIAGIALAEDAPDAFVNALSGAETALLPNDTQLANAKRRR